MNKVISHKDRPAKRLYNLKEASLYMGRTECALRDRLLTVDQVAAWLNLKTTTVRQWTSQERIPHVHLSRKAVRYPENEIKNWINVRSHMMDKTEKRVQLKRKILKQWQPVKKHHNTDIDRIIKNAKKEILSI